MRIVSYLIRNNDTFPYHILWLFYYFIIRARGSRIKDNTERTEFTRHVHRNGIHWLQQSHYRQETAGRRQPTDSQPDCYEKWSSFHEFMSNAQHVNINMRVFGSGAIYFAQAFRAFFCAAIACEQTFIEYHERTHLEQHNMRVGVWHINNVEPGPL